MLVRLNRRLNVISARAALEGIAVIVVNRRTVVEIARQVQPSQRLDVAEEIEIAADLVLRAQPRFVAAAVGEIQETLPRDVQPNAGVDEILIAVLNAILALLDEIKRVKLLQP
jgi:hypothetical protein